MINWDLAAKRTGSWTQWLVCFFVNCRFMVTMCAKVAWRSKEIGRKSCVRSARRVTKNAGKRRTQFGNSNWTLTNWGRARTWRHKCLQHFLSCRYSSLWVLACSSVLFDAFLSIAILLQLSILIVTRSSLTSSSHLNLCLPVLRTEIGLHPPIRFVFLCPFLQYAQSVVFSVLL